MQYTREENAIYLCFSHTLHTLTSPSTGLLGRTTDIETTTALIPTSVRKPSAVCTLWWCRPCTASKNKQTKNPNTFSPGTAPSLPQRHPELSRGQHSSPQEDRCRHIPAVPRLGPATSFPRPAVPGDQAAPCLPPPLLLAANMISKPEGLAKNIPIYLMLHILPHFAVLYWENCLHGSPNPLPYLNIPFF